MTLILMPKNISIKKYNISTSKNHRYNNTFIRKFSDPFNSLSILIRLDHHCQNNTLLIAKKYLKKNIRQLQ